MKLAHLLLVHKNPIQVKRLVDRLNHVRSDIFIHLDLRCDLNEFENLLGAENVYFINNRVKVNWGGYSTLQAIINGFKEILDKQTAYSHINLLSGQDYPLKDITQIQDFLFKNPDKSFVEYHSIDEEWHNGRIRISRYSFGDFNFPGRYLVERLVNSIMPKRQMPLNLKPFGRSTWLSITPEAARYTVDFLKKHPEIKSFFKFTWGADEIVIQTILLNSSFRDTVINDNLRFIDLGENAHPKIFTSADVDLLVDSGKLFARKFDYGTDKEVLDYLDMKNAS